MESRLLGLGKQQEIQQIVSVFDGPWLLNPRTQVEEELLHLDLLTHLQPSLALLKSLPSSNVLSLERKEDLLSPFRLCNRLHALSTNHRLQRKLLLQVFDLRVLSSNTLLELVGTDYELLICDLESYVFFLEVGNVSS